MSDNTCAKCGACTAVCPVYQVSGQESLTARGRLHLLEKISEGKHSTAYLDIFSKCLLCDACHQVCPRGINMVAKIIEERQDSPHTAGSNTFTRSLIKGCLSHQKILAGISKFLQISEPLLTKLPADSGLRLKLGLPAPQLNYRREPKKTTPNKSPAGDSTGLMLFPGCLARHLTPDITSSATELISAKSNGPPEIPTGQACCGLAFFSSGNIEEARKLARLNITAFAETSAPIIVLCGSCYSHLTSYPDLLANDNEWHAKALAFADRLRELAFFLAEQSASATKATCPPIDSAKKRVFYHDPCHLRYKPGLTEAPRQLLNNLPGLELIEPANTPQCCGFGGLFNLAHPDISEQIAGQLLESILAANPDQVATTCSGCLIQLRQHLAASGSPAQVLHLAQLLTEK